MKRLKVFFEWNHDCCLSAFPDSFEGFIFAGCAGFVQVAEGFGQLGDRLKFNVTAGLLGCNV